MKPKLTCVCLAVVLWASAFWGCAHLGLDKPAGDEIGIAEIKSEHWRDHMGKTMVVEGYFVDRPAHMLVKSMEILNINTKLREQDYIRLDGEGLRGLDPVRYYGAYVRVKGVVSASKDKHRSKLADKYGDVYRLDLILSDPPEILRARAAEIQIPSILDLCRQAPKLCELPRLYKKNRYALLISGGIDAANAHYRYWNDLTFMYNTLKSQYGFSARNILVAYKDGSAENNNMPVDYAADQDGIADAFDFLYKHMTKDDLFVLFTTNHGGGFRMDAYYEDGVHTAAHMLFGGRVDASGDESDEAVFEAHLFTDLNADGDENDHVRYDEVLYLYNETDDLWDDDLSKYLDKLKYDRMLVVMEQCFSGGFLADLRGKRRVIVSASSEYEFSWGGGPGNHDEFSYYFTAALAGQDHEGDTVDADANEDGKVSVLEAFQYASANDTAAETPFYEDSGDGRGHDRSLPVDGDGGFGKNFFLD